MVVVVTRHSLNIVDIDTNEWEFGYRHESYLIITLEMIVKQLALQLAHLIKHCRIKWTFLNLYLRVSSLKYNAGHVSNLPVPIHRRHLKLASFHSEMISKQFARCDISVGVDIGPCGRREE